MLVQTVLAFLWRKKKKIGGIHGGSRETIWVIWGRRMPVARLESYEAERG